MMRLGIDASNLRAGGGITHLAALLESADPTAHGIERVTVWGGITTLAALHADRPWLQLSHEPALDRPLPLRLFWQRRRLSALARATSDLLFVPGGSYGGGFRPFVTMSRNLLPFEDRERARYGPSWMALKLRALRASQSATLARANGTIFLNDYARATVMRHVPRLRGETRTIAHGVDRRFLRPPVPQKALTTYSTAAPMRILYVSTIDMYKHQWHVASAVCALRRQGLPLTLDLIGGAYPPALARLRSTLRGLDPAGEVVRYRGPASHRDLPGVYHAADLFVFASSCENMPNILLEAMAAGLPIACARRGPMPDILGEAGVYFDPEAPEAIAAAIERLAVDPDLRTRLAEQAFARSQAYSWDRCARETFGFLASVHAQPAMRDVPTPRRDHVPIHD